MFFDLLTVFEVCSTAVVYFQKSYEFKNGKVEWRIKVAQWLTARSCIERKFNIFDVPNLLALYYRYVPGFKDCSHSRNIVKILKPLIQHHSTEILAGTQLFLISIGEKRSWTYFL